MKDERGPAEFILPEVYIEAFLEEHRLTFDQIERGDKVWPTEKGLVSINARDIERIITIRDPVPWAYLNLVEREGVQDPRKPGEWWISPGEPWILFDVQAALRRISGVNVACLCASEVGKTRDIVAGSLHDADTSGGGDSSMVTSDSEVSLKEVWDEIEFQITRNPTIGRGVADTGEKPFPFIEFNNGFVLKFRICGQRGKQFRGTHITRRIYSDEVAMWKNGRQFFELWRAGKPGCEHRLYTVPDGDRSSPFYSICERGIPFEDFEAHRAELESDSTEPKEPRFVVYRIRKTDLPYPFWSEERAAEYRHQYGGEQSPGYQWNVLGEWGSPEYSVFPAHLLDPVLTCDLPDYRMVLGTVDHVQRKVEIVAARLNPEADGEGAALGRETIIARESIPLTDPPDNAMIARAIVRHFPGHKIKDMIAANITAGADVGSADSPTELVLVREVGEDWFDFFRLHLRAATYEQQTQIFVHLDCAAGHKVNWCMDNGSSGVAVISNLTEGVGFRNCPICGAQIDYGERLIGKGFGEATDVIDIETGEPLLNPDKRDKYENPMPFRVSNKEFSTQIMEQKVQRGKWHTANDEGAGEARLAAASLLTNHRVVGHTKRERVFLGKEDDYVDAKRQAALGIIERKFGKGKHSDPTPENCKTIIPRDASGVFSGQIKNRLERATTFGKGLKGFGP